jgi:capsular polysaccharide biosynthesis protein
MSNFDQEPSLFDVFLPLIQRWKLLVAGVLISVIAGYLITMFSTKLYKTTLMLQVGAVMDRQLEDSNTVVEILSSDAFLQSIGQRLHLDSSPKRLSKTITAETSLTPGRPSPLVTVTVLSNSPDTAVQIAKEVFAVLTERHKPMFDDKMKFYTEYEKELQKKIKNFDSDIAALNQNLQVLDSKAQSDINTKILVQSKIADIENQSLYSRRELRETFAYTSIVHSHPTSIVFNPIRPTAPFKPNVKLNLTIAFLAGTFLMVSFILIVDQYKKAYWRVK